MMLRPSNYMVNYYLVLISVENIVGLIIRGGRVVGVTSVGRVLLHLNIQFRIINTYSMP